ncbi:MAG: alanine--tRNA ligase [Myxococcota bacterium]
MNSQPTAPVLASSPRNEHPPRSVAAIREAFLAYFARHGHIRVASHSLLPPADPTLLFVNAGMVQFKDYFTGARPAPYKTATTTQKCLRVSGKHNDLENVGRTARHHTLFEMLGNFSFGDYFKEDAVRFAWEFLTDVVQLDKSRLVTTYFGGNASVAADLEARDLWIKVAGLPAERVVPLGEKDNFWAMGESGPCGPCTEIYFDLDPSQGPKVTLADDDGRYMEIWNLVFMQYDRQDGVLTPLPAPCVDTGMGLERIASVCQGVGSNYDTDLFHDLIALTEQLSGRTHTGKFDPENVVSRNPDIEQDVAFRVIADHARATAFLIAEGIYPDSEGRGFVLRRVMRRAIRFGRKLGMEQPFFAEVAAKVADLLGDVFPELQASRALIVRIAKQEEERFGQTLVDGERLLSTEMARVEAEGAARVLDGKLVFALHDTHGFPTDLTALIAAERGFTLDMPGFDKAMAEQRARGRASWKSGADATAAIAAELAQEGMSTQFLGYDQDQAEGKVLALVHDGGRVVQATPGETVLVVLDRTPLYGEGGGQVGDLGSLAWGAGGKAWIKDTQKTAQGLHLHSTTVESGVLNVGDIVRVDVEVERRALIRAAHSATHLLHKALRDRLGPHVKQRGSLVQPGRLRFDFSHYAALTPEEIRGVELDANWQVLANVPAHVSQSSMDEAVAKGALAFFGDKYGDVVRVVQLGDSTELCGGTHVTRTGDIGLIKILSDSAVSAGVRRVEAVCHVGAVTVVQQQAATLDGLARRLGVGTDAVADRLEKLLDGAKAAAIEIEQWKGKALTAAAGGGGAQAQEQAFGNVKAAFRVVDGADAGPLRTLADQIRDQLGSGVVALLSRLDGGKALLLVAVTKDLTAKVQAGAVVGALAPLMGGRGGGRPDMAQAGGNTPDDPATVADAFFALVAQKLA